MKSLKLALALCFTASTATLAQSATAQDVNPAATQGAQDLCEAFKINHGKPCTTAEQAGVARILHEFSEMLVITTQEESDAFEKALLKALAENFKMTPEQFQNPPGMAERRAIAGAKAFADQRCVEAKQHFDITCTDAQRTQLADLFKSHSTLPAATTEKELQQRFQDLINGIRAVFGMAPQGQESAPAVKTTARLNIA